MTVFQFQIITQIYTYLPSKLEEKDWLKIVKINSTKERFEQLKFYKKVETERGKDEDRRKRRKESVTEEKSNYNGDAEAMVMVHSQKMGKLISQKFLIVKKYQSYAKTDQISSKTTKLRIKNFLL